MEVSGPSYCCREPGRRTAPVTVASDERTISVVAVSGSDLVPIWPSSRFLCMTELRLRPAVVDDFDLLYQIHRDALGKYVEQTWGSWDEGWQAQKFREDFDVTHRQVIEWDGKVIGYLEVAEKQDCIRLADIRIAPDFQRRGIGTRLIRGVLERAAARGLPVTAAVLRVNPARRLYERLGFEVVDSTQTHYRMASRPAGALPRPQEG
jgi:ribosomal protein S18 acetylase RimI-like enzyme